MTSSENRHSTFPGHAPDKQTLVAYDKDAAAFAKDWQEQPAPTDLHAIIKRFFMAGGLTADIGCGSGREVGWLNDNGYRASGFDVSDGLLSEARRRYPQFDFGHAELPKLGEIGANTYDNVLCETVIMHLGRGLIAPAIRRLLQITKPGGVFYVSWRVTDGDDQRDSHGRLYTAFDPVLVLSELTATTSLLDEDIISASSGKRIRRLVARKPSS
jgi:SAM-dependent methyltransferase